jgi:hypothetical protein
MSSLKTIITLSVLSLILVAQGCSDMHTLVWNKAETVMDGHKVVIHACRNSYTRVEADTPTDRHQIFGCATYVKVDLHNDALTVNGKGYGTLSQGDSVEVKGDKVFINKKEAAVVAMK